MTRFANGVPVKTRLPAAAWILAAAVVLASMTSSFVPGGHAAQDFLLAAADRGIAQGLAAIELK